MSSRQADWLKHVRRRCSELSELNDRQLQSATDDLREQFYRQPGQRSEHVAESLALANEAVRRVLGWSLYDVQLMASRAMTDQAIVQMQTGEGKTISALPAAVFGAVQGRGVHIATPNAYLAERDHDQLRPVYELLGIQVGLIGCDSQADTAPVYRSDVTYGPGYEFGFDYLRDQRWLKSDHTQPRGARFLQQLSGQHSDQRKQRGLGTVIVDEADNVLIDDAVSPQVLSEYQPGEAPDAEAVLLARIVASTLEAPQHYTETADRQIQLTSAGSQAVHETGLKLPLEQLIRPWTSYIEAALRARDQFHCDVDYVIRDGQVKIVEQSTGRIFEDRSWQSGMHQAIEAKEGLAITPESVPLARITRQRFFRLYQHLTGMTGTVGDCGPEFKSVYQLSVAEIPLRVPSQRQVRPMRLFERQVQKWDAILESIQVEHRRRRPVLIGTRTIRDSRILAARLDAIGVGYALLNGVQDAEEAEIVARAGEASAITIATNLAGRGTDIKLSSEVKQLGGLHVIVSECHESYRADRQLIGRCGRQGDPGSCQTFVALDDWLIEHHAPWLGRAVGGGASGEAPGERDFPIESRIRNLQARLERQRFAHRLQLLQHDQRRNSMLGRLRQG